MTNKISDHDEKLIKRNVELTIDCENNNDLLIGYRKRITALETESEYSDQMLEKAQQEIFRLRAAYE